MPSTKTKKTLLRLCPQQRPPQQLLPSKAHQHRRPQRRFAALSSAVVAAPSKPQPKRSARAQEPRRGAETPPTRPNGAALPATARRALPATVSALSPLLKLSLLPLLLSLLVCFFFSVAAALRLLPPFVFGCCCCPRQQALFFSLVRWRARGAEAKAQRCTDRAPDTSICKVIQPCRCCALSASECCLSFQSHTPNPRTSWRLLRL